LKENYFIAFFWFKSRYCVEDTGSIISDYTEDDIDLPNDEPMDAIDEQVHHHHNPVGAYSGTTITTAATVGTSSVSSNNGQQQQQNFASNPSSLSLQNNMGNNQNNGGYHQRHRSTSLSRNGIPCKSIKKRSRTRSIDLIEPENKENNAKRLSVNASPGGSIKAITTINLNEEGKPTTLTSEIRHCDSDGRLSQGQSQPAKMEVAFLQPSVSQSQLKMMKNRKKRPSREFLHRTADESETNEESESFWNRSILEEVDQELASAPSQPQPMQLHIMTPIVEQPTPTVSETSQRPSHRTGATYSAYKKQANMTPSYKMVQTPFKPNSMMLPLAKKYKKAHVFNRQVILNTELCAHCDKRTKFGKLIMKCRECDLVCHTECKDLIQRACLSTLNFPAQGKISHFIFYFE
jgi:hypothetical protein